MEVIDRVGQVFGDLTVLARAPRRPGKNETLWRCRCAACGSEPVINARNLRSGRTRSCGCKLRKHRFDEHFFDAINTEQKAYLLGLLYADGCVDFRGKDKRCGRVRLGLKDRELMVRVAGLVGLGESVLRTYDRGGFANAKPMHEITLASTHMAHALMRLGCSPRKSLTCGFPSHDAVPPELVRHFVRGYFDGDGCVNISRYRLRVCIIGTWPFMEALRDIAPARSRITPHRTCRDVCFLWLETDAAVAGFRDWIYDGATISLERKKTIFYAPIVRPPNKAVVASTARRERVRDMLLAGVRRREITETVGVTAATVINELKALKAEGKVIPPGGVRLRGEVKARQAGIQRLIAEGKTRDEVMESEGISFGYFHHLKRKLLAA